MEDRELLDDAQIAAVKNALELPGSPEQKTVRIGTELAELGVENAVKIEVDKENGAYADITFVITVTERIKR